MKKTLVVGGGGFVGRSVQRFALEHRLQDRLDFTYLDSPAEVSAGLRSFQLDLLRSKGSSALPGYQSAIFVAGSADHGLAVRHPGKDLDLNVRLLLNFLESFKGSLVLLSSQAVYFGLEGRVAEGVDHVPPMLYGLTKKVAEEYAKHAVMAGRLGRLWILRLMYTYGPGERPGRLVPACALGAHGEGRVTIKGGGQSFINPLPASFVSEVLLKAAETIDTLGPGHVEVTNINHPVPVQVSDVVRFLHSLKPFEYSVEQGGEEWPVRFWGATDRLEGHLGRWGLRFPDIWEALRDYYLGLNQERVRV